MSACKNLCLLAALFVPTACSADESVSPLSAPVGGVRPVNAEMRTHIDAALGSQGAGSARQSIHAAFDALAPDAFTRTEASEIRRLDDGSYTATVIFDGVADDDSVAGFRYDMTIQREGPGWSLTEMNESWRCWPDRGHQNFSTENCS